MCESVKYIVTETNRRPVLISAQNGFSKRNVVLGKKEEREIERENVEKYLIFILYFLSYIHTFFLYT